MKEAAGEANLTVIAIILIGVIAAVVTPIINSYMNTTAQKGCCNNAGGVWDNNRCMRVNVQGQINGELTGYWDSSRRACTDSSQGG